MAFCSIISLILLKVFKVGVPTAAETTATSAAVVTTAADVATSAPTLNNMSLEFYLSTFGPVAVLFSVSLWLGNTAYLYLEVSYIQMLKAGNVVLVFLVGCVLGTEKPLARTFLNCLWIGLGLLVASYSEANFALTGFLVQISGTVAEAIRLQLVQMLLGSKVRFRWAR